MSSLLNRHGDPTWVGEDGVERASCIEIDLGFGDDRVFTVRDRDRDSMMSHSVDEAK